MRIRRFTSRDLDSINKWLLRNNHEHVKLSDLPSIGYIWPGVCAGFIRCCEKDIGILDSFVTNSLVSPLTRNAALDKLTEHIVKKHAFKVCWAFTTDNNTIDRAKKHGFKQLPHVVLTKGS